MRLVIIRDTFNATETLGKLYVDGAPMFETLELPWRNNSRSVSCIPPGNYSAVKRHSPKYKWHLHITNVPGRDLILIHSGNTHTDSNGCIILGRKRGVLSGVPAVLESRIAIELFQAMAFERIEKGERITLEVQ